MVQRRLNEVIAVNEKIKRSLSTVRRAAYTAGGAPPSFKNPKIFSFFAFHIFIYCLKVHMSTRS